MSHANGLHMALLRPAVLHIMRAQGFHSTRPSVLDTLSDLCARHLLLLAQQTAYSVYDRTCNDEHSRPPAVSEEEVTDESTLLSKLDLQAPTLTDVRHALEASYFFPTALTAGEEAWREVLRKPLTAYPPGAAREKERTRRDAEDTRDVRDFVDWCTGPANREIRRVAGTLLEEGETTLVEMPGGTDNADAADGQDDDVPGPDRSKDSAAQQGEVMARKVDYVDALKKKHSRDGARYVGTALGKSGEGKGPVKIEGGPETLSEWTRGVKRKQVEEPAEVVSGPAA